jgi:UDP-glucose:(heptosyl)LPS alpha-1,3-glucosyltransferase
MRLAIIRQRYPPFGGTERFLETALEALLERNVAISLYTREWPQTRLQLVEPFICDPFYIGRLWRDAGFARAVSRVIGGAKANIVQSHELLLSCDIYRPNNGVYAAWLDEELRCATAFARARIRLDPYHRYALYTERKLFASPWLRMVICNSKMVRNEIRDRFGVAEERLPVVYSAVDTEAFHPRLRAERGRLRERSAVADDATVFLHVSTNYARSGAAEAIVALAELPAPSHLIIVGHDPQRRVYRRLAHSLGIGNRVTFVTAAADTGAWYGSADAYVLPTVYDPWPTTAIEAMACGLPVITSTKSGAAELLLEYDGGLVCPARDVAGLAPQMRALLDRDTRARLGANARRAVEPLSPSAMTLKLVLLYRDLLSATFPGRPDSAATTPDTEGATVATPTVAAETVPAASAPPSTIAPSTPEPLAVADDATEPAAPSAARAERAAPDATP